MKKKNLALFCLVIALVLTASLQTAMAYFTTYVEAKGSKPITIGGTDIEEDFTNWTKHVVVTSSPDAPPVFVRAKAFSGSLYPLEYSGDGWAWREDGYYYYERVVEPGGKTTPLDVKIKDVPTDKVVDGETFNVVVVYESTVAKYNEDGTPYADWSEGGEKA